MPNRNPAEALECQRRRRNLQRQIDGTEVYPLQIRTLPAQPLLDLIDRSARIYGMDEKPFLVSCGLSDREPQRMRTKGTVTLDMADRFCTRLGTTLVRVYPEVYALELTG
jgi:hypothetical protein